MSEELVFGQRYERTSAQSAEAFFGRLADFLSHRLGGFPLMLELISGGTVVGKVDVISPNAVTLERNDGSLIGTFSSEEIAAFELVDEALDRTDELRPAER